MADLLELAKFPWLTGWLNSVLSPLKPPHQRLLLPLLFSRVGRPRQGYGDIAKRLRVPVMMIKLTQYKQRPQIKTKKNSE